jgi:outer membrane protein TolC
MFKLTNKNFFLKKRFFIFALLTQSVSSLASAETVDLKSIVNEALSGTPALQKSEAAYEEASWKKTEALQGFLPSLSGSINYLTDKRYMLVDVNMGAGATSIAQVVPTTLYTLNAQIPLFDGFASTHRYSAGQQAELSARHELEWAQFSIQRQATLQFYKTLASLALKDVAEQNLKTLNDHLKDAQALKKAGVTTNYDVLRVEVQVSEARAEVMNAQDNYEIAKLRLGEILGKASESRELQGQLPVLTDVSVEQLQSGDLQRRLDILALQEKVTSLQKIDSAQSRYLFPKIAAFGQYQYYNNINDRFSDQDRFREAYLVGLNLTWNFFDGMSSIAKSHQASAQASQLESHLKITQIKAAQDFEFWKRKFNYFKSVYKSKLVDVEKSTEAIRLAKEGRRAGTRTSTEMLDAELDLFRSRAAQVNSQIGAIESLINLELATGQTIHQF